MDKTRPPLEAFRFYALPESASVDPAAATDPRKFRGVPYSGDLVTASPFWDAVVFDLASTTAPPKVPVLVEHDRAQRAGFASLTIGTDRIDVADGTFLDNAHGRAVAADSDAGFPWQMSVHIEPGKIDALSPWGHLSERSADGEPKSRNDSQRVAFPFHLVSGCHKMSRYFPLETITGQLVPVE